MLILREDLKNLLFCYFRKYGIIKYTRVEVNMDLIRLKNV